MELTRSNSKKPKLYANIEDSELASSSTAVKIQEIRQQLESLLSNARGKKVKKSLPRKISISTISNQYCGHSLSITDANLSKRYDPLRIKTSSKTNKIKNLRDQYVKSLSISDSSSRITKIDSYENDSEMIPADAKLTAYKKFINSLTRVIHDSYQASPDSVAISIHSPTKSIEEKETFVIEKNNYGLPNPHANANAQRAEKTTYCRPVVNNQDDAIKSVERNAKLQLLVRKLVEAREKEKQTEAWNNYINELKNKHGYCEIASRRPPRMYSREDERPDIIEDGYNKYASRQTGKRPSLRELLFNDLYGTSSSVRPESSFQRRIWGEPSSCRAYKYKNNSFCLPMSSQARLLAMKRDRYCRYGGSRPRYFRGSSIIVERESSNERKLRVKSQEASGKSPDEADLWECRAIQTGGYLYISENSKECQISEKNSKIERITSFADQLRHKLRPSKSSNNNRSLLNIEEKLDVLIDSFNGFMNEMKSKKLASEVKSAGVSCSSISEHDDVHKAKSDTMSLFNKGRSIVCEVAQHHPRSTAAFPCPINQHTIDEIMNEERDKNDKVKRDIDELLNNNGKCAVKIMIDIPTKEHSTEVTSSFYKTQQEETIIEETEPIETVEDMCNTPDSRNMTPDNNNMTIAVNTEPLGLLALIRISTDTVKQILSYMPNLDYVSYLARKQVAQASPVARYVCNICGAAFAQPSILSDHIQEHELPNAKNCCVCRHVLDRVSARTGMFACAHCGQVFTRAYCRQLHEQTCPLAAGRQERRPSLMLLR